MIRELVISDIVCGVGADPDLFSVEALKTTFAFQNPVTKVLFIKERSAFESDLAPVRLFFKKNGC